ncbi:MAG: hypothetical protein F6J95_019410 [Leptolyngbya sp. SIO1E4]|nr:hypothetical protein [Leptolyngbya sp. SIO1E4]
MKRKLLCLTIVITSIAAVISLHLATLEDPTDIQKQLSTTTNTLASAGAITLFGLLDDDQNNPNTP